MMSLKETFSSILEYIKEFLSFIGELLKMILSGKDLDYKVGLFVAVIIDLYPWFSALLPTLPLLSTPIKYITQYLPDEWRIVVMAYLLFIAIGYSFWVWTLVFAIKLLPGFNMLFVVTIAVFVSYFYKLTSETQGPGVGGVLVERITPSYASPISNTLSALLRLGALFLLLLMIVGPLMSALKLDLPIAGLEKVTERYETWQQLIEDYNQQGFYVMFNKAYARAADAVWTQPKAWFERQMQIATGGYYVGQVDKYADKELGVFIKNAAASEKQYFLDAADVPIQVFANIEGQSLEPQDCDDYPKNLLDYFAELELSPEEKALYESNPELVYRNRTECQKMQMVELGCKISNRYIHGAVDPAKLDLFEIQGASVPIDCTFPRTELQHLLGSQIVDVIANFSFVTKSYLKTYLMDNERLKSMKRQKLDPLATFKITDKKPRSVYTGGPIMIGLGIDSDQPLGIDAYSDKTAPSSQVQFIFTGQAVADPSLEYELTPEELEKLEKETEESSYLYRDQSTLTPEEITAAQQDAQADDAKYDQYVGGEIAGDAKEPVTAVSGVKSYRFGITLENKWKGKIAEIYDLEIMLPRGLNMKCLPYLEQSKTDETKFVLTARSKQLIKSEGGIDKFKTFNCRILPRDAQAARDLLQNLPIVTKYIMVTAKYLYRVQESATIRLSKGDGLKTELNACEESCTDTDGCICAVECPENKYASEVYKGYNCDGKTDPEAVAVPVSSDAGATGTAGTYCWVPPDVSKLTPFRFAGKSLPNIAKPEFQEQLVAQKRTYVTNYFEPLRNNFQQWSVVSPSDVYTISSGSENGREMLTDAYFEKMKVQRGQGETLEQIKTLKWCVVPNRGFYEEVQCQGHGIDKAQNKLYHAYTIRLKESDSPSKPITNTYTPKYTVAADSSISKGTQLYIWFGAGSPWNCCYVVEDRGSAIIGNHLDLFVGNNPNVNPGNSYPKVYEYPNCKTDYGARNK